MKEKSFRAPLLIAAGVIALVSFVTSSRWDAFERLERMTYDMRAREAVHFPAPLATNLGFVFLEEASLQYVRTNRAIGLGFGLYWPRQVYGRLVSELASEGARAVAFDILFGDLRPDHSPILMQDSSTMESDDFFAIQVARASNVILAATERVRPPPLFETNALRMADIITDRDSDGVLRRVQAFRMYPTWHTAFLQAEADRDLGINLDKARFESNSVVLPRPEGDPIVVPLDAEGNFDLAAFVGDRIPPGMQRFAKPLTRTRVWHMGVVLAALDLGLSLDDAEVDLPHGRITLKSPNGTQRVIPVDQEGYFFVDWALPHDHPKLTQAPIQVLLEQYTARLAGATNLTDRFRDKLVVVGSGSLIGNDLTDRGATPLRRDTLLVSKHWNVANSIINDHFVRRTSPAMDAVLIALVGALTAWLAYGRRVPVALTLAALLTVLYVVAGVALYIQTRWWIPLALPVLGMGLMTLAMIAWRVVVEQAERRRIKSIFSTVVSEKILDVLLESENLALGGARREITIMFADVRGFTELTDRNQAEVSEIVRRKQLTGDAAEARYDEQARETLNTVNTYLGLVADTIIRNDATLDKFIGDCVMAFWGAPTANPHHAVACVRAAIAAQLAIYELNQARTLENQKLELENLARISAGLEPKPLKPCLLLGSGINTGMATAGLMGSGEKTRNYTVFGREVNLASRLEGLSGRGRIFINETTYAHLRRDDPELAAKCVPQPPAKVKGIATLLNIYEVPWRPPGAPPFDEEITTSAPKDSTTFTGLLPKPG